MTCWVSASPPDASIGMSSSTSYSDEKGHQECELEMIPTRRLMRLCVILKLSLIHLIPIFYTNLHGIGWGSFLNSLNNFALGIKDGWGCRL